MIFDKKVNNLNIDRLFEEFASIESVNAIALGGSRATGKNDESSDYDVYVYVTEMISEDIRREILGRYCTVLEIGNKFWEYEDNCVLNNSVDIDIIYRDLHEFEKAVENVVEKHIPSNGYTTCMWHNLVTCKIIYDRQGELAKVLKRFSVPYPQKLRDNIIARNMKLLSTALPSYDKQIHKANSRCDLVSINHRVTEFLASYFDVIFALNNMTHPGEKRLLSICKEKCSLLPNDFEKNITELFCNMYNGRVDEYISKIVQELNNII